MSQHSHRFVEEYDGLVGFGLNREVNGYALTYYIQKFGDDRLMAVMRERMSDGDMEELFNLLARLLKNYLTEEDYHRYFLMDMPMTPNESGSTP